MVEVNLLVLYLFFVLAFVGGFVTCAILCFSRGDSADEIESESGRLEENEHA